MTEPVAPRSSPVVLRGPRSEDADRIASVHVATWKEAYADLLPDGFFTEDHARMRREMWTRILAEPRDEWSISVAESDGEIIGFAMAGPVQEAAEAAREAAETAVLPARELYTLYVLRSHHGTGAGQALLDATLGTESGTCGDSVTGPGPGASSGTGTRSGTVSDDRTGPGSGPGTGPTILWVAKQNPRAIAFYLRNGFRLDGVEVQDPGVPAITDVRMVRP